MAVATVGDCKLYCKIQTAAEDTLHAQTYAAAVAILEAYLGAPIIARDRVDYDDAAVGRLDEAADSLICSRFPCGSLVVTDGQGTAVDSSTYRIDARTGLVRSLAGYSFPIGPYGLAYKWGLDQHPDFSLAIEPVVNQCIKTMFALLHQRRTPGATSEGGGGTSVSWSTDTIPAPLRMQLAPWRQVGVALGGSL